jgi:hypothetical protein
VDKKPALFLYLPRVFDEISIYNPHVSNNYILSNFWRNLEKLYSEWANFSEQNNLMFTPTLIPGFNDTKVRPQAQHSIIPRDPAKFIKTLENFSAQGYRTMNICSFNEWHEDTQIEPSTIENTINAMKKIGKRNTD